MNKFNMFLIKRKKNDGKRLKKYLSEN